MSLMPLLRSFHRWNAALLGLFLTLHLATHAAGMAGVAAHLAVLRRLREIYRGMLTETLLIGLFAVQILLGVALAFGRGWPRGGWAWLQVLSGGYLVFFLLQHVPAILLARMQEPPLDTDSHFAAAVVSRAPFVFYFGPYYALALAALAAHLAAALRFRNWPAPAPLWLRLLPLAGLAFGLAVVAGLSGLWSPVPLPPANAAYLERLRAW
ncbi:hypothetical protein [Methylobacterium nodulans]|uniref:Uncharacterized protein n=1 Tax=Methylobacterium nodulans (strain LMG 21967 / CNCM I-2342 / ORS 2060) TaxID=460265 RepID=B8IBT8_METNO|nr:hypothetical protein [Methylobacterium nodulans]ACL59342.1 conserved hypothetical protein [Methylobacterium nodulans ORS 2060]